MVAYVLTSNPRREQMKCPWYDQRKCPWNIQLCCMAICPTQHLVALAITPRTNAPRLARVVHNVIMDKAICGSRGQAAGRRRMG